MSIPPLIENLMMTVAVGVGGLLLSFLLIFLILRRHERRPIKVAGYVLHLRHLRAPLRLIMPPIFMRLLLPLVAYSEDQATTIQHVLQLWIIAALGAFAHSILVMVREMLRDKYPVDVEDNLEARRVMTQFRVVERILTILIVVVALSAMLMTFESVRQFGVSLLASAGILGIVLGFAAQQSLGTLLAGIQIAMSQPIRLDDVVIVEGEWGRVEEITLTYVVVRIWDERRLIVPITYFLNSPFENWTYTSAQILGTVYLYTDYTVPIEAVRDEFQGILEGTELWDGRVGKIQVTDSTERALELRALVSAEDSSKAWALRVHVRERLIDFLQRNYPDSLPRLRLETDPGAAS